VPCLQTRSVHSRPSDLSIDARITASSRCPFTKSRLWNRPDWRSLGLALRQAAFSGTIVGCDKPAVLEIAETSAPSIAEKLIWNARSRQRPHRAGHPVGCICSQLEAIALLVAPDTLITDTAAPRRWLVQRARLGARRPGRHQRAAGTSHGRQGSRRNRTSRPRPVSRFSVADYAD